MTSRSAEDLEVIQGSEINALLAHRYPFLLVDRIEIHEPGRLVVGHKRISGAEWWCVGTEKERPIALPFTLVIEAMAQTSAGIMRDLAGSAGGIAYFMGVTHARLRTAARPGDELFMQLSLLQWRRGLCRTHGVATAGGRLVASADLTTIVRRVP